MFEPVPEASLTDSPAGRVPERDGWFIVNVAEGAGSESDRYGRKCRFSPSDAFPEFAINVRILQPGQPNGLYHRENAQETFLVLSGECIAIVEEQERPMRTGDFLYAPPGTAHIIVGAGEGPCAVLMAGTREGREELLYPVSEVAARHGASAARETSEAGDAYVGNVVHERPLGRIPWWPPGDGH
jgi:uncharacterized cupin superfamily protein